MKIGKFEKLVVNLHDKTDNLIHIRILKQALDHGLVLKTFNRITMFNQETWLKPYVDMNRDLRKEKKKNWFWKIYFFKLINGVFFVKTTENVRKDRDIKLVSTEAGRNYLVSDAEARFDTSNFKLDNPLS